MNKWRTPQAPTGLMCSATPVPSPTTAAEAAEVVDALAEEVRGLYQAAGPGVDLTRFIGMHAVADRLTAHLKPARAFYDGMPDGAERDRLRESLVKLRDDVEMLFRRCGLPPVPGAS